MTNLIMIKGLLLSIPLLFVLTSTAAPQNRSNDGPSIQERARRIEPFIDESARRYGVDARVLRILCFIESRYRLDAVSPKGARGPMQFMPETAKRFGVKNPHDPREAIDAAARYLRDLLRKFGGRLDLALAAYNAGEGTVESFQRGRPLVLASGKIINPSGRVTGGIPPYPETQVYVRSVIGYLSNNRSPKPLSVAIHPSTSPSGGRDFTLEVSLEKYSQPTKEEKEKTPLSFIEIPQ